MLEPIENQYLMVGHIAKLHGVDGTILVVPEMSIPTLFNEIELLHLQNGRGDLIPARIESFRVQQKNNRLSFFVKFEHITDRDQAERVKSYQVYIARDKVKHLLQKETSLSYISFKVMSENRTSLGFVVDVIDSPAHPILCVESDEELILIPFVDEYIQSADEENEIIYCKNLHQLTAFQNDEN